MKAFLVFAIVINTIIFGCIGFFTIQTNKITEQNLEGIKESVDLMNKNLKSISTSLDDKLFAIYSRLPASK
jgi:hypothetical protein